MREKNFTVGGIVGPLVLFVFPIMFTMLIQSLYGAVDLLIVGQFSDPSNVSAVSIGSQLMSSVTMMIVELAVGSTVLLGQYIGQRREAECGGIVGTSIVFFGLIGLVVSVIMQPLATKLAAVLNAPPEAFSQTVSYIRICSGGAVFIVGYNILGSIFRGIGDAKMPLIAVIIAAVFNVFGDLLFVSVFGLGAAGAALATVMAQALSVLLSFFIIRRRGMPFPFSPGDIGLRGRIVGRIVRIGAPLALQDMLVSVSFLIILALVNTLGVIASAGVGVAEKLCGFIMLLPMAFSQAMSSFVAQNYGAGKMHRANRALFCGIAVSFACNIVIAYFAFFHGAAMSRVFSPDTAVCLASSEYLKGYAIDCLLTAYLFCFLGYFNGCSKTAFVMAQGIIGAFCFRVPLCILFSRIQPVSVFRISLATPCSSAVQIMMCAIYFLILRKHALSKSEA